MVARQRAYNEQREENFSGPNKADASGDRQFDHPGALESMIPIWGSGKEALADLEDGNYAGAAINAGLAASDVFLGKAVVSGLLKGGLKMSGPYAWRSLPRQPNMRKWLGEKGFLKPGQPGHHWVLEQKSSAPEWLKNQPPFIKPMKDAVQHGRVHGKYTVNGVKLPQYNAAQRIWFGTPQWAKAGYVSSAGHAGASAGRLGAEEESLKRPRR